MVLSVGRKFWDSCLSVSSGESDVVLVGIAERQRAVRRDGRLEIADLEAVESRSLGAEHRRFGKDRVQGTESAERPRSGRPSEQMTA
jgi:hypothetical protein